MTAIALRAAREGDLPFLRALRARTMRLHYERSGLPFEDEAQDARVLYRFDCARIVVCDGVDAGLFKICRESQPWELIQIQLQPTYQGRGIGAALIRALQAEAAAMGADIELSVLKVNPAQQLYAHLGFRVVGEDQHALTMRCTAPSRAL